MDRVREGSRIELRDGTVLRTLDPPETLEALLRAHAPGSVGVSTLEGALWVRLADIVRVTPAA